MFKLKRFATITLSLFFAAGLTFSTAACKNPFQHIHTFANSWSMDEKYHWRAATCEHTDEVTDKEKHYFGKDTVCDYCGYNSHVHTYSVKWSGDETHHWHEATCKHTEEKKDYGEHNFVNRICTICKQEQVIPDVLADGMRFKSVIMDDVDGWAVKIEDASIKEVTIPSEVQGKPVLEVGGIATDELGKVLNGKYFGQDGYSREATYDPETNSFYYLDRSSAGTEDGSEERQKVKIPLVAGQSGAFSLSQIQTIHIPSTVKKIQDYAFAYCTNLETVTLENNVTSIGRDAFLHCNNLKKIDIPDSVTEIGSELFMNCTSLEDITIGTGITQIRYDTWSGCNSIKTVRIKDIQQWSSMDFDFGQGNPLGVGETIKTLYLNDQLLTDLVIPEGITEIVDGAFQKTNTIKTVTFPSTLIQIGNYCFQNDSELTTLKFHDEIQEMTIRSYSFSNCTKLKECIIPKVSMLSLSNSTFENCTSLTKISLRGLQSSSPNWAEKTAITEIIVDNNTSPDFISSSYMNNLQIKTVLFDGTEDEMNSFKDKVDNLKDATWTLYNGS